jgi:hypothetical protein
MFHSIPAVVICGEIVFLVFKHLPPTPRFVLTVSAALGYLSHLILDEVYSLVNFEGLLMKPKSSLGSALNLWSNSLLATGVTYLLLLYLGYIIAVEMGFLNH